MTRTPETGGRKKRATNMSLGESALAWADKLMPLLGYKSITPLVEQLIRDEYERRFGYILATPPVGELNPELQKVEGDEQGQDRGEQQLDSDAKRNLAELRRRAKKRTA
jgi:hypothetical protein